MHIHAHTCTLTRTRHSLCGEGAGCCRTTTRPTTKCTTCAQSARIRHLASTTESRVRGFSPSACPSAWERARLLCVCFDTARCACCAMLKPLPIPIPPPQCSSPLHLCLQCIPLMTTTLHRSTSCSTSATTSCVLVLVCVYVCVCVYPCVCVCLSVSVLSNAHDAAAA